MTHVITGSCCADAACVPACPVDCIHPTPGEPDFGSAEMLYIDAATCIDCGACVDVCPVSAITTDYQLTGDVSAFEQLSARYFEGATLATVVSAPAGRPPQVSVPIGPDPLRVAVVGAGPAGMYTVAALLDRFGDAVRIDLVERLPTPWGLLRSGVAPDHQSTKQMADRFSATAAHPAVTALFGISVGTDVTHEELQATHHAVIYAVGAPAGRAATVPGVDLAGSHTAAELVGWYNGHPDHADLEPDLSHERAVVVGNGNVALDVARMLLADDDYLSRTDISARARSALSTSAVRHVTVLGRRGPEDAAFTDPELLGLMSLPGVALAASRVEPTAGAVLTPLRRHRLQILRDVATRGSGGADRTLELAFWSRPEQVIGTQHVTGIEVVDPRRDGASRVVECGLVVSSVGFDRVELPGVTRGTGHSVAHDAGRLVDPDDGSAMPGVYAVGWFKRGPSGQLGTNRTCAEETVASLASDVLAGRLQHPSRNVDERLLARAVDVDGWLAIDDFERRSARGTPAPRVKVTETEAMLRIAASARAGQDVEPAFVEESGR